MRPYLTIWTFMLAIYMIFGFSAPQTAQAAEGAGSNYYPGTYGDIAVAMQPPPGSFTVINYLGYVSTKIDRTVLNGKASVNVDIQQVFDSPLGLYTFKTPVLGGALFSAGGWLAFPWASLDATVVTPIGSAQTSQTNYGIGQSGLIPAYLTWKLGGDFSLAVYEAVYIPLGQYSTTNPLNLNRGYFSFDTNVALTWFHEKSGTEFSADAGLMANTVNPYTHYQTGNEFHLEYVVNQFVNKHVSVGLHGYYYQQVTNDRVGPSTAAALNLLNLSASSLSSRSNGLGPQVNLVVNDNLIFAFSWIHDLYDHYRMPSDYFYLNTYIIFDTKGN